MLPRKPDSRYLAIDGLKLCRDCESVKPVSDFYEIKEAPDGYSGNCKECARVRSQSRYQENRERKLARDKERNDEKIRAEGRTPGRRRRPERHPVVDGIKRCTACDQELPVAEFLPKGKNRQGLRPECRTCTKKRDREVYQRSRDRYLAHSLAQWRSMTPEDRARDLERQRELRPRHRERNQRLDRVKLLRRYGLTEETYGALLAAQDGKCAICGGPYTGQGNRYHVDHEHGSGIVRGLLCSNCNTALGLLGDSVERLSAAIRYLQDPPARTLLSAG